MSSLMMKAAMVLFASLLSGGKPSAAKNRADAARSLTGRLTAILVDIGASVVVAGEFCFVEERREWKCGDWMLGALIGSAWAGAMEAPSTRAPWRRSPPIASRFPRFASSSTHNCGCQG